MNCNNIKNIYISTNLITNYKPVINDNLKNNDVLNLKISKQKNNNQNKTKLVNQIYCKNFFIFILLIKYKNNFFFNKSSVFIKKFKKKIYTILRSPYRHKLARHQISLNRYEVNSSIKIKLDKYFLIKKWNFLLSIFKFIKSFNNIFESNLIYTNSIKIKFPIIYEKNFNINNFFN